MRLGLLGPVVPQGDPDDASGAPSPTTVLLESASGFLLNTQRVGRTIYLGADDALEVMVERWARRLVGDDPTDDAAWKRAAKLAGEGNPENIDAFVRCERMRLRLRSLESLPHRILRTMEMVGDRIAILINDKAHLDEEDIFAASILIYGKNDGPMVRKIGARWFVTPGVIGANGGIAVLDDSGEDISLTVYNVDGKSMVSEKLVMPRPPRMRIQGGV
jgi:hypothetical protein